MSDPATTVVRGLVAAGLASWPATVGVFVVLFAGARERGPQSQGALGLAMAFSAATLACLAATAVAGVVAWRWPAWRPPGSFVLGAILVPVLFAAVFRIVVR